MRRKPASSTPVTVRLTPSIVTEPFSTTYRSSPAGAEKRTSRAFPPSLTASIVPTPSTWPCTMCPPSRSAGRSGSSRFTRSPSVRDPRELRATVSGLRSAVKAESPELDGGQADAAHRHGVPGGQLTGERRLDPEGMPSPSRATAATRPISSTIPVNIRPSTPARGPYHSLSPTTL